MIVGFELDLLLDRGHADDRGFERALAAGRLADAIDAGSQIETDMPVLAAWIAAAERRATLDDMLARFGAEMAARLARAGKVG